MFKNVKDFPHKQYAARSMKFLGRYHPSEKCRNEEKYSPLLRENLNGLRGDNSAPSELEDNKN